MDAGEIVVHEIKSQGLFVILKLLTESVGQPSEPAHARTHCEVLPFCFGLPEKVRYSTEAMSLNENRCMFPDTDVNVTVEQWFRGVHSDIGGRFANHELSDYVLQWMTSKEATAGVSINL